MIVTKNALYLHIPKTAGKWVYEVLEPIALSYVEHNRPNSKPTQRYVYTFVRNPWDWHVSMYEFLTKGSDLYDISSHVNDPIIRALPNNKSFEDFVLMANNPTDDYKRVQYNTERIDAILNGFTSHRLNWYKKWLNCSDAMYQHSYNLYTEFATYIGKYETLREDLLKMVVESGDITDQIHQRIVNTEMKNVTINRSSYKEYYNENTRDLISKSCKTIIENHGYEF